MTELKLGQWLKTTIIPIENKRYSPKLSPKLKPLRRELKPFKAPKKQHDSEIVITGEIRVDLELEGVGAVAVISDGRPRLPRLAREVSLEVVAAEAPPVAKFIQRRDSESVDIGSWEPQRRVSPVEFRDRNS